MSEQNPGRQEQGEQLKPIEHSNEQLQAQHEKEVAEAEKNRPNVEQLAQKVEQHAISGKELSPSEREQPKQHPLLVNKHLKDMAFSRAVTRAQKRLAAPDKVLSKVIHNDFVDKSSEFVGKTVARPSAMLGGSMLAFIGTSALLWISRYYGYEYNYLAAILLFVFGMAIGLLAEATYKRIRNAR